MVHSLGSFKAKYPVALIVLMHHLFDTSAIIGQGIAQEILLGNVQFNKLDKHLARSSGPCRFCVNKTWQFPEGCQYEKPEEPEVPLENLLKVSEYVMGRLLESS